MCAFRNSNTVQIWVGGWSVSAHLFVAYVQIGGWVKPNPNIVRFAKSAQIDGPSQGLIIYFYWSFPVSLVTPLIPTSARRAMAERVVCRATTERLPSGHRANSLGSRSVATRRATTEQPPGVGRARSLGGRAVGARWSLGRQRARPVLAGRWWGLVVYQGGQRGHGPPVVGGCPN